MRGIAIASALLAGALGCGAAPNQPLLANAPRPNPGAVAGVAAGAAAAITLADPDAATRGRPEKHKDNGDKKPIKVKENVPADVLDRADKANAPSTSTASPSATKPASAPAGPDNPAGEAPKSALDFGSP